MTPSNPDNQQPLIYRIADALGITHLVVAVQHSHLMSEIEGLASALAGKADTNHTHKLIQYSASASTDGFAGFTVTGAGSFTIGVQTDKSIDFQFGPTVKASITNSNVDNLARALRNPDTTPTASSDKLVTSGGVAAALAAKMDNKTIDSTPTANSTNLVTSGGVKAALEGKANKVDVMYSVFEKSDANENIELDNVLSDGQETSHFILINRMGEQIKVSDFFYTQYGELVENGHTLSNDSTAIVKIIHYNDGSTIRFYMVVEEVFEA